MLFSASDCDDCVPSYLTRPNGARTALSTLPFVLTFLFLTFVVHEKVHPWLAEVKTSKSSRYGQATSPIGSGSPHSQNPVNRLSAFTFSATIALSAVLSELLLCEISNSFNPTARGLALQVTVTSLLAALIVVIPLLELYSVIEKAGWKFTGRQNGRLKLAWVLEFSGFAIFLVAFWAVGRLLPHRKHLGEAIREHANLVNACLERLGITGISLMALLSGFASVSSVWQTFIAKVQPVSEADISRKQAGVNATKEMLSGKKERLSALQRKMAAAPVQGFWSKAVGSVRGNADTQEAKILELEVAGLEAMISSLENSMSIMKARRDDQLRTTTYIGCVSIILSYIFSLYCVYRITTTVLNILRRWISQQSTPTATDPVTNSIAIFARHFCPSLDQASWARQISFLLSGIILLTSFSAVAQTFRLFGRFIPSVLHATRSNFALLVSQISGMYVISSALLLRGTMPKEVRSVINDALGGAGILEPAWVEKWFDGFFVVAVVVTVQFLWLGRKLAGSGAWDDDDERWDDDVEMGKRV